jgi:hypothetical protein
MKNKSRFGTNSTKTTMAATLQKLSEPVAKYVLHKQLELRLQKRRCVSIEQTIDILIKDAYLTKLKKEKKVQVSDTTKA